MATKPETKLALEMIHMQFMPAEEGILHLLRELESNANDSEVLITDDRYYRAFYPAETLQDSASRADDTIHTPLLTPEGAHVGASRKWTSLVSPTQDPFLAEHLLDSRPLLPFVIATEMLYEAGAASLQSRNVWLKNIRAHGAVRFFTDVDQQLFLSASAMDATSTHIELRSDFLSRKGVLVDPQRLNFSADAVCSDIGQVDRKIDGTTRIAGLASANWQSVSYPEPASEFYVGWPLQKLRKVALTEDGLLGKISAPALIELAGVKRNTVGWRVPCAALDSCLFAVGILAWQRIAPGSALPVSMGELRLGRLPRPGEACMVHAKIRSLSDTGPTFNFTLYGVDGSVILDVIDYEVAWLSRTQMDQKSVAQSRG